MITFLKNKFGYHKLDGDFKELLSHSKNYLSANVFLKGISFLTIPVFTRLLAPSDYGNISVFMTLTNIFSILFILGADGALYRYYFEKKDDFFSFMGTNFIFLVFADALFVILLLFLKDFIISFFSLEWELYFYAIISSLMSIPFLFLLNYYQCSLKSRTYSVLNIIKYSSITILAIVFILFMKEKLYLGRIYGELFVGLILWVFSLVIIIKYSRFHFDFKYIKYTLLFGIPLLPGALSQFVLNFFDRLIINQVNGENEVGLYSFAFNIGMVMNTFVMGMNQSWAPLFYDRLKNEKNSEIHSLSPKYVNIIFSAAIVLILFSREIVFVMGEKRYHEALNIIPVVMLGYVFIFLYTLYANYAFYHKKVWQITIFTVTSGIISVASNYFLIPRFGYKFASVSALLSYFTLFILHYANVRYVLKIKNLIPVRKTLLKLLLIIMSILAFYACEYFSVNEFAGIAVKLLYCPFVIYLLYRIK